MTTNFDPRLIAFAIQLRDAAQAAGRNFKIRLGGNNGVDLSDVSVPSDLPTVTADDFVESAPTGGSFSVRTVYRLKDAPTADASVTTETIESLTGKIEDVKNSIEPTLAPLYSQMAVLREQMVLVQTKIVEIKESIKPQLEELKQQIKTLDTSTCLDMAALSFKDYDAKPKSQHADEESEDETSDVE